MKAAKILRALITQVNRKTPLGPPLVRGEGRKTPRHLRVKCAGVVAGVLILGVGLCCQQRRATREPTAIVIETPSPPKPSESPLPDASVKTPAWLFTPNNPKSGAEGEFDPRKNKIIIRTHEQRDFAIDTSQLPIDWDKLVILSIDGKNSELRRRDFTVYRFQQSEHGEWLVQEAK